MRRTSRVRARRLREEAESVRFLAWRDFVERFKQVYRLLFGGEPK